MASKSASTALALGLAVTAFLLPPHALAVHDTGTGEGSPAPQGPPTEQPPPERMSPPEPAFLPNGVYYGFDFEIGVAPNFSTDADFEVGADIVTGGEFVAGYHASFVRLEAAIGIQNIQVSSLKLGGGSPFPVDNYAGGILTGNLMANLYIESPIALFGRARPYVGVGHGFSVVHAQYTQEDCFAGVCAAGNSVVNDSDLARSRQIMAGMTFSSAAPGTEYFFGYRMFETADLEFRTTGNVDFAQQGVRSQTLFIGARIKR